MCLYLCYLAVSKDDPIFVVGWDDAKCINARANLNQWAAAAGNNLPAFLQQAGANANHIPSIAYLKSNIMARLQQFSGTAGRVNAESEVISPNTLKEYCDVRQALYDLFFLPCLQQIHADNLPLGHAYVIEDKKRKGVINITRHPMKAGEGLKQIFD